MHFGFVRILGLYLFESNEIEEDKTLERLDIASKWGEATPYDYEAL